MIIDPNTTHLSNEEKFTLRGQLQNLLQNLSPREFANFLISGYQIDPNIPETLNVFKITSASGALLTFNRVICKGVVEEEIISRLSAPTVTYDMVAVTITPEVKGSVDATRLFLDAYEKHVNLGPDEPVLNRNYTITRQWLEWYSTKYSVTSTVAWNEGAKKLAAIKNVDLTRHSFYLGEAGEVVYFLKPEHAFIRSFAK